MATEKKGFHTRGFISLLTFGSFIVMTVNGIILYFAPQGRIADWVIWRFWGITREAWSDMHVISSLLFVAAGIYHLIYNWKPFVSYISKKVSGGLRLKKELVIATALSLFVIFGPIYAIPPLNYVTDFAGYLKGLWVVNRDYEPPFGHAEQVGLKTFTKRMNIDFEKAMAEFKANGIKVEGGETSLDKIAKANETSPMRLYAIIKKFEQQAPVAVGTVYTPEMVDEKFSGMGVGRKTLGEMCKEAGIDINQAKEKLRKVNIDMKDDETMKDAATKKNVNPMDVLKVILIENYKLP